MNKRDIELAAEAGAHWEYGDWLVASSVHFGEEELQRFAELIRADEREAILKLADSLGWVSVDDIRARGDT
jgi:ribosomal protein L15E